MKRPKPKKQTDSSTSSPNILMIMVDQMRFPGYGPSHGFHEQLKNILGFKDAEMSANSFVQHLPGFMKLRNNSVVLNNHRVASAACVPSRTAIFTGQYGTRTGATQTDGIFKSGADPNFPWLDQQGVPTLGDWMREVGYTTHYFGKWHISGEATDDLEGYGFSDWNLSYPDPHGSLTNNLGYYRDYQFRDLVTSFLRRQGLGVPYSVANAEQDADPSNPDPQDPATPWFAVASFTNPHDIASYPVLPGQVCNQKVDDYDFTLAVPEAGTQSNLSKSGTMKLTLNETGFPQDSAENASSWNEQLRENNKPDCQFDYSYKMGLSLNSSVGKKGAEVLAPPNASREQELALAIRLSLETERLGLPFVLTSQQEVACKSFMQYYSYLLCEVDQHINSVLQALEESGQADNTIVIFCPDHGEYGGAHYMMMEKWHTGYEEVLHVPMVVHFPESMQTIAENPYGERLQQQSYMSSHIDILPTVLGFAGVTDLEPLKAELRKTHNPVYDPVGTDISPQIQGDTSPIQNAFGGDRKGVLFMTYDTITEPLEPEPPSGNGEITSYEIFWGAVDELRTNAGTTYPQEAADLNRGSVRQPSYVHCVVDVDRWKLVRYFDLRDETVPNQYELYDLTNDPTEEQNLLVYNATPFQVYDPNGTLTQAEKDTILARAEALQELMSTLEAEMLAVPE